MGQKAMQNLSVYMCIIGSGGVLQACSRQSRMHVQRMPVLVDRVQEQSACMWTSREEGRVLTITAFHFALLEARCSLV